VNPPLRVGIIGAGYWGPNLIRTFIEMPEATVEVVVDRSEPALAQMASRFPYVPRFTGSLKTALELDLDAVVIATPPETHFEVARTCLEAGLDVLVEKPLTTKTKEAAELVELAARHERILMVGHIAEFNPAVRRLGDLVKSGDLGDIRYIDGVRAGLGMFHPRLNVVWDLAPHDVSIFMYILQEFPKSVRAHGIACIQEGIADVCYLTLQFESGPIAHTRLSWLDPHKARRINVIGSSKMAVYDDLENIEKLKLYDRQVDRIMRTDTFGAHQYAYHYGNIISPHIEMSEPLRLECEHFLRSVVTRESPMTDGLDGLRVVRVIEAAQESLANNGAPVSLPSVWAWSAPGSTSSDGELQTAG
jgi:predicted dehydrogenase